MRSGKRRGGILYRSGWPFEAHRIPFSQRSIPFSAFHFLFPDGRRDAAHHKQSGYGILEHFRHNISDHDAATGQTCVYGAGYCRCWVSDDGDWYWLIYRIHFVQEVHMPQMESDIGEDSNHQIHPPWQSGGQVEQIFKQGCSAALLHYACSYFEMARPVYTGCRQPSLSGPARRIRRSAQKSKQPLQSNCLIVTDGMDASPLHRTGSGEFQKGVLA